MMEHDTSIKIEQEIDAALKKLRDTQPPAAMLSRVHQNMEVAVVRSRQARSGRVFWIPATSVALTAVLSLIVLQGHFTGGKQVTPSAPARMAATTMPATEGIAATGSTLAPAVSSETRGPSSQPAVVQHSRRERPRYRHVANLFSHPLTRQEKLLVRFAQTAAPKDLQALNPEYQARVEAQQEAEFAAYLKSRSISSTREIAN